MRGGRAFIHHTTSRHGAGVRDGAGRGPVIRAEGALHATLAWAGERKQENRAGASVALPEAPRGFSPDQAWGEDRGRGCAGAGAEAATSTPQGNLPFGLCKALAGLGSAPGPTGNAQHRYLQSKTELINITNN